MKKQILSKDFEVGAIGLGCMGFSHAYGAPTDDKEAIKTIRQAVDIGYDLFDTAEVYGTQEDPHCNEVLVGKALKPYRNKVKIISKFGIQFDLNDGRVNHGLIPNAQPEVIRKSIEGSLKRLQSDHIDLYFQHRIDPAVEPEAVAQVMADLIKEGKILHWGISEANENYIRRANAVCPITAVENRYSMMARQYESLFAALEELGIGLVAFSPMANGFLTAKYNKESSFGKKYDYRSIMPQFSADAMDKNKALIHLLYDIAKSKSATPAQISLAWMICKKPWIVPIPGTRKIDRLKENAGASDIELTLEEVSAIDTLLDNTEMSAVFGGTK